jgi:hypothetical protein
MKKRSARCGPNTFTRGALKGCKSIYGQVSWLEETSGFGLNALQTQKKRVSNPSADHSSYSGATARDLHPLPYSPRFCERGTRTLHNEKSEEKSNPTGEAEGITHERPKSKPTGKPPVRAQSATPLVFSAFAFYLSPFSF